MSLTSPTPLSVQPLALSTSRVGSYAFVQAVIRSVSYCPHPSLNGTHRTIEGWFERAAMTAFHSDSTWASLAARASAAASDLLKRALGMSCQTKSPSLSHQ